MLYRVMFDKLILKAANIFQDCLERMSFDEDSKITGYPNDVVRYTSYNGMCF